MTENGRFFFSLTSPNQRRRQLFCCWNSVWRWKLVLVLKLKTLFWVFLRQICLIFSSWTNVVTSWIFHCEQKNNTCYFHFVDIASDTHVCTFHDSRYSSLLFSSFLLLFLFTIFNFVNVCCCALQIQNHCGLNLQNNAHRSAAVMC